MTLLRWSSIVPVLACTLAAFGEEPQKKPQANKGFGLIFCYSEMKEPKDFLTSTPCITGVHWRMTSEDDKHWIGELHYPTENTGNYKQDAQDRTEQYYMVTNVMIRKQNGLPIDPKTFEGALVLRDPKPEKTLAMRGDGTVYELVGYEDKAREGAAEEASGPAFNFLFANHPELKFVPAKKQ